MNTNHDLKCLCSIDIRSVCRGAHCASVKKSPCTHMAGRTEYELEKLVPPLALPLVPKVAAKIVR